MFYFDLFVFCFRQAHTILLVQSGSNPRTRTYSDYESVNECMEGVCKIYEAHLKRRNPNTPTITYDISQLFDFVDQLSDLSCLVYQKSTNTYAPYNKDWIKEKIYILLRQAAGRSDWFDIRANVRLGMCDFRDKIVLKHVNFKFFYVYDAISVDHIFINVC